MTRGSLQVHERSLQSDFLLALLRDLVRGRRAAWEAWRAGAGAAPSTASGSSGRQGAAAPPPLPLKVVLMSATLDATKFAEYYGNCSGGCRHQAGMGRKEGVAATPLLLQA